MRKFINASGNVASETLEGFLSAYGRGFRRLGDTLSIVKAEIPDRVVVVTGGGSGHEPGWLEYIGQGFADAVVQGDVFAAPSPNRIVEAAQDVHRGKGLLFLYANYSGDKLNFEMAAEDLADAGINVKLVCSFDDVAGAPHDRIRERRGIAGGFYACKIAGAAAEQGLDLKQTTELADRAAYNTRSIGVASAGGTVPGSNEPTFVLPEGKMEIGLGMHGEKGVKRADMMSADEAVTHMIDLILEDASNDLDMSNACMLVNGLGATTRAELFIACRKATSQLKSKGIKIHDTIVGEVTTSQEMHGFSISLLALDDELQALYDARCNASFYRH